MTTKILRSVALLAALAGCAGVSPKDHRAGRADEVLFDARRNRSIPIALYQASRTCGTARCPVVLLSPGYGLPHTGYGFLAEALAIR